jgi:hypothetical protein
MRIITVLPIPQLTQLSLSRKHSKIGWNEITNEQMELIAMKKWLTLKELRLCS